MTRSPPQPVRFDIEADLDTPVSAFLKLTPLAPRYLLESVHGNRLARYSFIGFGDAREHVLHADHPATGTAAVSAWMRAQLATAPDLGDAPFDGGMVGFTSYDIIRRLEPVALPRRATELPDAAYVSTSSCLVFDHVTRRAAVLHAGPDAGSVHAEVRRLLSGPVPPRATFSASELAPSMSEDAYVARVHRIKEHILAGDVFQLVLSLSFEGRYDGHPFEVYRALRSLDPAPYATYVDVAGVQIVGASPEALVRLDGDQATLRPIAGTRPRGDTEPEDLALEAELRADDKEAAEHVMLVDLARNDLGRVAVPGTVRVEPFRTVERYRSVMHLVSGVVGQLEPPHDAFDLFAAAFPAGTVSGAPKVRAMQLIDELEPSARGIYAGCVGRFGHRSMDQAIAIRSLTFQDGVVRTQAGAGIVADSVPRSEFAECLAKAATVRRAVAHAGGDV